ncbi:hypothetical protein [Streptomyces griseosporeus]|uniref:hypothetical protein n=1 Tax=Streptomyces griseosporeus TaxID=1910 RepID=UPI00369823E2
MGRYRANAVVRGGVVAAVAGALVAGVPASAGAAGPGGYGFDPAGRALGAATTTSAAGLLEPGGTYRSTLPAEGRTYYRLALDATSTAYVAVTAVPPSGAEVAVTDGIRVAVQDADGHYCSTDTASVGAARTPRPVTAWGTREAGNGRPACQDAGTYYVVVERLRSSSSSSSSSLSSSSAWELELTAAVEAPLKEAGETTAPGTEAPASAPPLAGPARKRPGGNGFAGAAVVGQGVWSDTLTPGRTLFYKVPVDWGQRLSVTAELGSAPDEASGLVAGALGLSLYNPARVPVDDATVSYGGGQKTAALDDLPPVRYRNRYAVHDEVSGMRFAGTYYLAVHLSERITERFGAGPFDLTLRVRVAGAERQPGPGYAGDSTPADTFRVTDEERRAAALGGGGFAGGVTGGVTGGASGGADAGGGTAMKALAAGGIGAGTLLLAVLGGWTLVARRRAGSAATQTRVSAQNPTA